MEGDVGSGQLTPIPPLTAPDRPESRLGSGRWPAGICWALLAASLAVVIVGALAWVSHRHSGAAVRDEAVAVATTERIMPSAMERNTMTGTRKMADSDKTTVKADKNTALPAVASVPAMPSMGFLPAARSSR